MENIIATFVRVHNGRLAQYAVQGVGKVYVTTASFPDKANPPATLDVTALGLREATEETVKPGDSEKAALAAEKAKEKADKAAEKAKAAAEKAAARVAKAQEAAAKAVARAEKAAAAAPAGDQPEL